eukprot:223134-Chlamydomonas_euryale.AAC.2
MTWSLLMTLAKMRVGSIPSTGRTLCSSSSGVAGMPRRSVCLAPPCLHYWRECVGGVGVNKRRPQAWQCA